jgi:hypothetical protein
LIRDRSTTLQTVADSAGRYSIEVPIGYGTTTAIIRSGESGRDGFERTVAWNPADRLLPVGTLEYQLGGGISSDGSRDFAGDFSLRGGIATRWTVDGYASGIMETIGPERSLHAADAAIGITGWLGRSSAVRGEVDLLTGAIRGRLSIGSPSSPGVILFVDSITLVGPSDLSASARLPLGPIRVDGGSRFHRNDVGNIEYSPFGSVRAGIGNTSLAVTAEIPRRYGIGRERDLAIGLDLFTFARSWLPMRAGLRWHRDQLIESELYLQASAHLSGGAIAAVYATVPLDAPDDTRYTIRLELPLGGIRPVLRATTGNGMTSVSTTVEGNMQASLDGVRMLPIGIRGQSSFLLTGFEDRNTNGLRDPGEPSLGRLNGDLYSEGTRFGFMDGRIDAFAPFRRVSIEVDRFSMASLGLFPNRFRYEVTTGPSTQTHIDVPFAQGYEVNGRIGFEEEGSLRTGPLLAALTAWVTSESGLTFEGEVFSDGSIYFAGVPKGKYQLSFDERQLRSRGLCPPDHPKEFTLGADTHVIPETVLTRCSSR